MPVARFNKKTYKEDHALESVLPKILKTPSGLALLEIQGTITVGKRKLTSEGGFGLENEDEEDADMTDGEDSNNINQDVYEAVPHIGEFDFSDIESGGSEVVLRIGKFQRLRGKLTKLKMPLAVLRMDPKDSSEEVDEIKPPPTQDLLDATRRTIVNDRDAVVEVPILDIIYYKILFSTRPEPIVYG